MIALDRNYVYATGAIRMAPKRLRLSRTGRRFCSLGGGLALFPEFSQS